MPPKLSCDLIGSGFGMQMDDYLDKDVILRNWDTPGPISTAFLQSLKRVSFIVGPVGSGKSTTADVVKCFLKAPLQKPGRDGIRRYRQIVFRKTQRSAYRTTIKTFQSWIPPSFGKFIGSEDRPCSFSFKMYHPEDGGIIECEIHWYGLPDNEEDLVEKLKGVEATDMNFAEATELTRWAFDWALGRIGRYPSGEIGECVSPQIFGTFNACDYDNWVYELFFETDSPLLELHIQPAAILYDAATKKYTVNPKAENIAGFKTWEKFKEYYETQLLGKASYIKHALMVEFGPTETDGFRVYPEFVYDTHCLDVAPNKNPLFLGIDGGSTPAAVVLQWGDNGEINALDEIVIFDPLDPKKRTLRAGVGPTQFASEIRRVLSKYPDLQVQCGYIDPSAFYGGDSKHGDLAFAENLSQKLDILIKDAPVPGNARILREQGARDLLSLRGDGGRPLIVVSKNCRWLLQGLRSTFLYESITKNGRPVPNDKRAVVKNEWSHVCEGWEYGVAGMTNAGKLLQLPRGFNKKPDVFAPKPKTTYQSGGIQW